jgi:predicted ferric reductase
MQSHASAEIARTKAVRSNLANFMIALIAAEGGIAVGIGVLAQSASDWSDPGLAITAVSRVAAMTGTYLALVCLVLVARIPWLEKELGQDVLVKLHRKIAPYSLYLIVLHVVLVSVGYGLLGNLNAWQQFWSLVLGTPWMMPAFIGFIFMMMVGITSYKRARSRMKYDTWYLLHLYAYLGIALSFAHTITSGIMFVDNDIMRYWWIGLYVLVVLFILGFRVGYPLVRTLRHDIRVEKVVRDSSHTVSVVMKGKNLERLKARGGQFFTWRFLGHEGGWEGHPYSLSARPTDTHLRITVKDLGDHSKSLAKLKPGTRVLVEGPYGVFTADAVEGKSAVLIAGGVGITPIRALLEELPDDIDTDLIWRASNEKDLSLKQEVEELAKRRGTRIHYMVGSRKHFPLSPARLTRTIPHILESDIFLCGPEGLVEEAKNSILELGFDPDRLHDEAFAY